MSKKTRWAPFPHPDAKFDYAGTKLAKAWAKLHAGDLEPFPDEAHVAALLDKHPKLGKTAQAGEIAETLAEAWRAFHRGDFQDAFDTGTALGPLGASVAIKAAGIHATHLLDDDTAREKRYAELVALAEAAMAALPDQSNSHYRYAFALGRYSQCISIAKALTQGLAGKVRDALQRTLGLAPDHAEAHTALGLYHAEVVSKVGGLIAGLTYGAKAATGEALLQRAIELTPNSPIAHIEFGNGLMLLYGSKKEDQAAGEYEKAARLKPLDAMEKLDAEFAASQIED
jgi:tetratricopeptide (TPR) repeat protein